MAPAGVMVVEEAASGFLGKEFVGRLMWMRVLA